MRCREEREEKAKKKEKRTSNEVLFGATDQNRTDDLMLTKHVLYQLSHSSKNGDPDGARTHDLQRDRLAY